MRALLLIIFLLLIINLHGYTQTEKGSFLIGGSGNINWPLRKSGNFFSFNISPQGGYFVGNNLALGVKPSFSYFQSDSDFYKNYGVNLGISPFIRYYLGPSQLKLFFQGSLGVAHSAESFNDGISTYASNYNSFFQNIGVGLVYFVNENIGLEGLLNYDHYIKFHSYSTSGISLNLGFQIYFKRKSKIENKKEIGG